MTQASVLFNAVSTLDVHTCRELNWETTQDNSKLQETSKTPTARGEKLSCFLNDTLRYNKLRYKSYTKVDCTPVENVETSHTDPLVPSSLSICSLSSMLFIDESILDFASGSLPVNREHIPYILHSWKFRHFPSQTRSQRVQSMAIPLATLCHHSFMDLGWGGRKHIQRTSSVAHKVHS